MVAETNLFSKIFPVLPRLAGCLLHEEPCVRLHHAVALCRGVSRGYEHPLIDGCREHQLEKCMEDNEMEYCERRREDRAEMVRNAESEKLAVSRI